MTVDPSRDDPAPMSKRMARFLAKPPKRLAEASVASRANKCVRGGGRPKGWLEEACISQQWRCAYCGISMRRKPRRDMPWLTATLDHVLPISRGGRNQRWNLVAACHGCNQAKGSMTADEFRAARDTDGSPKGDQS
jgi:5-methylcytosine-specific restriction endonuclease McrA